MFAQSCADQICWSHVNWCLGYYSWNLKKFGFIQIHLDITSIKECWKLEGTGTVPQHSHMHPSNCLVMVPSGHPWPWDQQKFCMRELLDSRGHPPSGSMASMRTARPERDGTRNGVFGLARRPYGDAQNSEILGVRTGGVSFWNPPLILSRHILEITRHLNDQLYFSKLSFFLMRLPAVFSKSKGLASLSE